MIDAIKVLEDGDLQTLGLMDYDKRLSHAFIAHPKIDLVIGEMFTLGYAQAPPYVTYRVISKDGVMNDPVPITVAESMMMHDFAITENYAIFMDLPLYFMKRDTAYQRQVFTRKHVFTISVIRLIVPAGSVIVPTGSVVTTGSVIVPTGSVVTTGSVIVPAGSVIVPTGSVVTTGSVIVPTGSVVTTGSVIVPAGSVITSAEFLY
ncbi:carotenoid cleavage dioxygenase 1 [Tanacetum coccineum]